MKSTYIFLLGIFMISSCTIKPQPIDYGNEICAFCSMNIVDQRFGSEIVTNKGKVYKFDAIECLVNFKFENPSISKNTGLLLTNTLDKPGQLIEVEKCQFLHSKTLPSPMGMYLNPVSDEGFLLELQDANKGQVFTFGELSVLIEKHYHGMSQN